MYKILVISFLGVLSVTGQILQDGQCNDNIVLQESFNITDILGKWYEIARADHAGGGDCSSIEFTEVGDAIAVFYSSVRENFYEEHNGLASVPVGTARLTLNLPSISSNPINFWVMNILETSMLTYGCENVGSTQRQVYLWHLSREPAYTSQWVELGFNVITAERLNITSSDLRTVSHTEEACYTLPVIQPGESVILPGQCNENITGVLNFQPERFLGVWHQIRSYYSENALGACNRAQYSDGGDRVNVVNSEIINQSLLTIEGYATVISTNNTGLLSVTLEILPGIFVDSELVILGTDYDQWAVSYTCSNLPNNTRQVFSWVVSRTRQLPAAAQVQVNEVINSLIDLNSAYYIETDQSDTACFYIPETVEGSVIFGGQCNLSIPVVSNFSAVQYMGLWHEIERYTYPFQFGSCHNANYSLGDNGVDVYNTQVVNERLLTIEGTAVPVDDGKLVVYFPVENTNLTAESDYWVLSTDYDSYALVYSCRNINYYQQQVTLWKLSRTKQLSVEAQQQISNVTSTLNIFSENFFQVSDQSEEGCFYYPDPQPGVPVEFPGSCESDITVVPNFNITQFQGAWYEVEAYPKEPQEGQCINHEFTDGTGSAALNFFSSYVDDQLLGSTNGQLTFYANETGGRFTLSFETNGTTISFPYYVIATDYTNYALVYSCLDITGTDFRGIYAWKLSRTRQLSNNAITQINDAIGNSTVVLSNDYFEPIDQSDDACFYFPDLAPGELVVLPGQCDTDLPVIQNFNATRYLGRWRVIESYPSDNEVGQCNQANYSVDADGSILVYNNEVVDQSLSEANGFATLIGNGTEGKLNVTFPSFTSEAFELWILDTDYESYSIAYACTNLNNNQRRVQSWKLSRTTSLTQEAITAIEEVTSNVLVLNDRYFQSVDQSDDACFYYPVPGSGPNIFRGQCNESIPVVTGFDAVAYMGLWHDIESYAVPFQDGSCPNAYYSLNPEGLGDVVVYNTQVFNNETLDTITGYANLVPSNDTSAKLEVFFPTVPFAASTPYWVLSTDYTSYALVYSCVNINDEQRSVSSWKLSRTKSLNATAANIINDIVATIPVLDQRYYNVRDQSPEGCFYIPEAQPGVPVRFPGTCESDIAVVPNFNTTLFEGEWFEVEAYPKDPHEGQCVNHDFSAGSGSAALNFESFFVDEQLLGSTNGQLVLYANETGSRFTLSFITNGTLIEFPYYVIATDYTDYALVYSCLEIPDTDFRGIWAWKLSRTRQLSNNAITQINDAIGNSTVVLSNDYFEPVDQSDDACFYFPDLAPGEPVVLPGQCDTDLPVIQNFNATRYLGRWRVIESYPSDNEVGQCNQANYSVDADGSILVYNNEVVDQSLSEANGFATLIGNGTEGKLNVTFPSFTSEAFELWILDTDYESYSIAYACTNLNNNQRRVQSWKLSRTTSLTQEAITAIEEVTSNVLVLNDRYFQSVDQSDDACFYYPVPGSGPNIFRGQCNESIPVVTGFDAVAYMGLWHDIESYAVPFQDGSCPNAYYSLNPEGLGDVVVYNTQVFNNETLDTITGYANLVPSNDTSAKLEVFFPTVPFAASTPYWVLSTDYTSYALVYSCVNINDEQRSVSSWKLSRTKSLNATAANIINDIVATIPVLDQRYYNVRDQSPEGCFYIPEAQPGVPVRFPGTCESDIAVVPNFNTTLFEGEWFEVEAYPKDPQEGQCVNHDFSAGSGSAALNFESFFVDEQLLGSTNGQLVLYANETGGRFTLSFITNGTLIEFPYYVIATDYTDYALVYSCLEIPDTDFRGIWAWKLSRTRQLSNNAITQINDAIGNSTVVLSNDYFEPVDQSDDACFYFPDLAPGEPVVLPGQCDTDLPVIQNFNATRYLGRWRVIESYPSDNEVGQCNQANYSVDADGSILVYNNEVVDQSLSEANGFATLIENGTEGKLNVTFPSFTSEAFELWILDTDYESYSIAYACTNLNNNQRRVQSWKLSRTTSLTQEAITAIEEVTSNVLVLNDRYFQSVDQSDDACFYYPVPGSGPNIFRGQCNESIPVVTGFDAVAYMGLWHDIESYAVPFQDGSCPNAYYSLNPEGLGDVVVYNTQVFNNETLDTITGYANLVPSNDTSAKLEVFFPTVAFAASTPYWVLSTDYTSYALVYSCVNINDEQRSVSSWKLSRTKSLNATAGNIINDIVATIPVLDQRYYNVRDQSPEGCFYFPEPQPGVPLVFPGQCNENINVINDFNLTRFSGVWHEIQAYPQADQNGQCVNHEFTISSDNNSLGMQSYNVIAQSLGVTEGSVSFAYNDTTARMALTYISNGTVVEIPFWIIDTDYDNYALAYSCVNIDDDYRGVWSWKLSRTKQLRAVDNVAINNTIANIDVLANQYYEEVNQSDEACFFYPDTAPGEIVVFPGQCSNISAIPNFNATAYLGLWRTIESYPSEFQLGTCGDATYSLGDGVVVVYNTEVVGETLSTIYGTAVAAADGTGRLSVTFPDAPFSVDYYVLDTDYETYSLVYSCVNSVDSHERTVFSWKLGRSNTLPQAANAAINNTINSIDVLDQRYYAVEDRSPSGCFYFPEPNNSTVIFRGQCDQNITVQPNFDAVAYTGVWYNIESYPAPFQNGTCATATYTLDEETGVVLVENTQVLRQVLDVQTGTAVVVDNAKLAVTFEVNGVTITSDYWILATDYITYSLVYSCQNINDEYKQVNSWKLSRSQSLPDTAEPLINEAISNVQVLQQRYYETEGHSQTDCFFYPDNEGGDVILDGQCVPDNLVPAMTNFNIDSFSGVWHEVARFPSDLQEGECAAAEFASGAQNTLTITQTIINNEFRTSNSISGIVSGDNAVINSTVGGVPFDALYILDTDYEEYAMVYGCRNLVNNTKQIYSWILARSREGLSEEASDILDDIISENDDLFKGYYDYTDQSDAACFHYPVFEVLPENIQLDGPCNETIRGIENFDATAYTGLWLEIERYPQSNQFGTCDRAFYSAGDGNVLVRNTQVVGDSLLEQLGSAVVASTDGTGLLNVTFDVNGVTVHANYYILATDYDNYALVYSCRNVNNNRIVSSWKLGRTASLSAQAEAAINTVIEQTQGLNQPYYQATSQSADDCFYIPEVNPNSAPLFRGSCEAVSGVANLNVNLYAGWWHELERYPVDSNIGECISSQYSFSGNAFQVVDTSVSNGLADIVNGIVSVSADGRLTRVLSNGVTEEIFVLDTDYNNYALLYSCVDVVVDGEAYRRVWSAKHSKSRDPSSVNVASINQIIENNSVLYASFYQQVNQNDQACFYYPEVHGQRVILPGQCDLSIPVQQDFDVARYGGTWYQIQRYPQVHENPTSTCIGARYTLDEAAGVVDVLNWEVIDGVLETIEGTATVVSADGSAQLEVILPIVGTNDTVTTPLYVLSTDYDDYSLVYSCSNVNEFQRSIGVWKLSRERSLSLAGNTAINSIISSREELDARYFLTIEHNEECEEPSSGVLVKSSVLLILVCAFIQMLY